MLPSYTVDCYSPAIIAQYLHSSCLPLHVRSLSPNPYVCWLDPHLPWLMTSCCRGHLYSKWLYRVPYQPEGKKTDDFTKSRSQFLGVQLKLKEHLQFTYRSHGPTCLLLQYLGISGVWFWGLSTFSRRRWIYMNPNGITFSLKLPFCRTPAKLIIIMVVGYSMLQHTTTNIWLMSSSWDGSP